MFATYMTDFSRAFDMAVHHPILMAKLTRLNLPAFSLNWIISFHTGRSRVIKIYGVKLILLSINTNIIQ